MLESSIVLPEDGGADHAFVSRRGLLMPMLGLAALAGTAQQVRSQVSSAVDTAPVQFALNMHYLTTSYTRVIIFGRSGDNVLPANLIRAGETIDQPGVRLATGEQVAFPASARAIRERLNEIADDHRWRLESLRQILRAEAPAQKEINISAAAFTAMFQMAGAIPAGTSWDPYASPVDAALGAAALLDVLAASMAAIVPLMTNDIARAMLISVASVTANHSTVVRGILQAASATRPELISMLDRLSAWRNDIAGPVAGERGLTPTGSGDQQASTLALVDADGLFARRSPERTLNIVFMSRSAVRQGGFFPTGINGIIAQSAAA